MDKATLELGATAASRKYSAKLGTSVNKSTMQGLKKVYVLEGNLNQQIDSNYFNNKEARQAINAW